MVRKVAVLVVIVVVAVVSFFVFYHPPMRLMPPPLLLQTGNLSLFEAAPAPDTGTRLQVFYATNRVPIGTRDSRIYTVVPDQRLHIGRMVMRIGDETSTLDQIIEWSRGTGGSDRPFIHLELASEYATLRSNDFGEDAQGVRKWLSEIDAALERSRAKEIIIYVHGANTTVERAAGQASQLRHFSRRNAVVVLFAWPTAENFLRYSRDIFNAFASAPHLAQLVAILAENSTAESIGVFTYSAGATVGSEGLALIGRDKPEIARRIGEVYHAAPDADFRDFIDDLAIYETYARRVTVAANLGDSALRLSQAINRASRAGRPDLAELSPEAAEFLLEATVDRRLELLHVTPDTMPQLSATSHTFWYDDPWVSNDVLLTVLFHLSPVERELTDNVQQAGKRYWTFPADYPDRIVAVQYDRKPVQ